MASNSTHQDPLIGVVLSVRIEKVQQTAHKDPENGRPLRGSVVIFELHPDIGPDVKFGLKEDRC